MPIEYDVDEAEKLVFARGVGTVSGSDIIEHLDQLAADGRYVSPMKKVVDYRSIEGIDISPMEAQKIARKKRALGERFRKEQCAFVSPGDLSYGLSRVHQSLLDSSEVITGVFRRIEEAWEWLGFATDPTGK